MTFSDAVAAGACPYPPAVSLLTQPEAIWQGRIEIIADPILPGMKVRRPCGRQGQHRFQSRQCHIDQLVQQAIHIHTTRLGSLR